MAEVRASFIPDRILIHDVDRRSTVGVPPSRTDVRPDVIFVRKDGWKLGAPADLEAVAYVMWKEDWVERWRRYSDNSGEWWVKRTEADSALVVDTLTVQALRDACAKAVLVLDRYAPITIERDTLAAIRDLCTDVIGGSHQGCAATVVILERDDDQRHVLDTCPACGTTFTEGCATCAGAMRHA